MCHQEWSNFLMCDLLLKGGKGGFHNGHQLGFSPGVTWQHCRCTHAWLLLPRIFGLVIREISGH